MTAIYRHLTTLPSGRQDTVSERLVLLAAHVIGQDQVQPPPGLLQQPFRGVDLLGRADLGYLDDAAAEPGRHREQVRQLPGLLLVSHLPRTASHLGVLLYVGPARIGEAECAPSAGSPRDDQAVGGELRQGRVDRARAWPPGATAALIDLGDDLVTVAGAFRQHGQD